MTIQSSVYRWYRQGTVAVTNGSTAVTGTTTAWSTNVKAGDGITFDGGASWYEVESVTDNTHLVLASNYGGSTTSGASYAIDRRSLAWQVGSEAAARVLALQQMLQQTLKTTGQPPDTIGSDGAVAYDATAMVFYTNTGGVWDTGTSFRGSTVLNGAGAPSSGTGNDADFYIDTTNTRLYGPKTGGTWGSYVSLVGPAGSGDALTSNPLSQFAATTSAQLRGVISEKTGSGSLVFATSPTLAGNIGINSAPGSETLLVRNASDVDMFMQIRSGVDAGTDRRAYFSWLDTNAGIRWHYGKNPGHSIILFDYVANTHRLQLNTAGAGGTPADGVTYINSGSTGAVEINGFGESGTGTGGFRVWSGGATPSALLRTTSGGTIVGANSIDGSAVLQADSTTKGFLPPRMTTAQRTAISSPVDGLMVFDTDLKALAVRSNSAWKIAPGKQYYVLANLGGSQQSGFATSTYTKVNISTEVSDADGVFSSYRYTAPETGIYFVRGSVNSYNGYRVNAYLFVNGSNTVAGSMAAAGSLGPSIVAGVLSLTAGDYVELYAYQDSGSTDQIWGNTAQTNFSAVMIR